LGQVIQVVKVKLYVLQIVHTPWSVRDGHQVIGAVHDENKNECEPHVHMCGNQNAGNACEIEQTKKGDK
jgi:hypothetical protein